MGSKIPLESWPPKTEASKGTETMPAPCTPVFDIPVKTATRTRMARYAGLSSKENMVKCFLGKITSLRK
jgi:hypothetical protein